MRRFHAGALSLGVAALTLVLLTGCPKNTETTDDGGDGGPAGAGTRTRPSRTKAADLKPVEGTGTGTLKGRVTLKGPKPDTAEKTKELQAAMKAKDEANCLMSAPEDQKVYQAVRVGANNGVGNVVVFLRPPDGHFFKFEKDKLDKGAVADVVLDQPHCAFVPHVLTLFPKFRDPAHPADKPIETGQKLVVKNSAHTSHNTKLAGGIANPERNQTLESGGHFDLVLNPATEPVSIACDIHKWMGGYAWVLDHPYAAVTRAPANEGDDSYGTYEIKGVPTGVKGLRVVVWHELPGFVNGAKGEEIELQPETTKNFELELPQPK
jgi:hypothetical protein